MVKIWMIRFDDRPDVVMVVVMGLGRGRETENEIHR